MVAPSVRPSPANAEAPTVIERERRFLVDDVPTDLPTPDRIVQGYLTTTPVSLRVRHLTNGSNERFILTVKAGTGMVRTEVERDLTSEEFAALWEAATELRIDKRRHRLPLPGGLVAELDLFDGEHAGHRLVEVEFDDDDTAHAFRAPSWFGREVTTDGRYTNASIARFGWPDEA